MSVMSIDTVTHSPASAAKQRRPDARNISQTLELSESRTYDAALETLGAYKLTGNFPTELEIVLKDLRVLDKVTFDIKPKSPLSDCRHVEFRPTDKVHRDRFIDIMRTVRKRIGAGSAQSWWVRLFQ
ncbi:MAG: hypothetical protein WB764_12905 [Xanthobacteraceae bacterium]